jgi:hypothetical protein
MPGHGGTPGVPAALLRCVVADKAEDDRRRPQPADHHAQRSYCVSSLTVRDFQAHNIGAAYPRAARWTP